MTDHDRSVEACVMTIYWLLQHRRSDIGILLVRRSPRRSTWTFSKAVQCVSPQRDAPLVPTLTGNAISSSTFRRSDIGTFQTRGGPPSIPRTRQPGPSSSAEKSCLAHSVTLSYTTWESTRSVCFNSKHASSSSTSRRLLLPPRRR